jgi:hypothetical protein
MTTSWEDLQKQIQKVVGPNKTVSELSKTNPELLELVRSANANQIANSILSVQPMGENIMKDLLDNANSEQELIDAGYEPVSKHGLLWVPK